MFIRQSYVLSTAWHNNDIDQKYYSSSQLTLFPILVRSTLTSIRSGGQETTNAYELRAIPIPELNQVFISLNNMSKRTSCMRIKMTI